jgi:hypothetical protein
VFVFDRNGATAVVLAGRRVCFVWSAMFSDVSEQHFLNIVANPVQNKQF